MAGLSKKDRAIVLRSLEEQGAQLEETKNGTRVLFPDGGTHMLHHSESDRRSVLNNRAAIRRHGMTWPFDHLRKDRDMSTRQRRSTVEVRSTIEQALDDVGDGPINPAEISREIDISGPTLIRHLRELGWESEGRGHWYKPRLQHRPGPSITPPAPPTEPDREFLDSVDSWTVKLTTSTAEATVGDLHKHYKAAGLRMEIRVWRDGGDEQ